MIRAPWNPEKEKFDDNSWIERVIDGAPTGYECTGEQEKLLTKWQIEAEQDVHRILGTQRKTKKQIIFCGYAKVNQVTDWRSKPKRNQKHLREEEEEASRSSVPPAPPPLPAEEMWRLY